MAKKEASSIDMEVEYQIFAMERILMLLFPFGQFISALGLVFTTILAVVRSFHVPTSRELLILDGLFWVERVGCILVWWSFVEGIIALWFAALLLYGSSTFIRIQRMDFYYSNFQLQLQQEKKLKKMAAEMGTQTEDDKPDDQQHKVSKKLEEAEEIKDEDQEKKEFELKSVSRLATAMTTTTKRNNKTKDRIAKLVEVKDNSKQLLDDANYQKELKLMNDGWGERLNEERESRKQIIHNQITFMSKFFSDIEWLMQKGQLITFTWENEKRELERRIESTIEIWEKLQEKNEDERWGWDEERSYYVRKIRKCEDEIERLEEVETKMAEKMKEQEAIMAEEIVEKCHRLEEEIRVLDEKLHKANGMSEFYKNVIRTIDI